MALWRTDLAISGPGWLEATGTVSPLWAVQDALSATALPPNNSTLTWTLIDTESADEVATATLTNGTSSSIFGGTATPSQALVFGRSYTERVEGTVGGQPVVGLRDAYVSTWAAALRLPLLTSTAIRNAYPTLANEPAGGVAWEYQLRAAHGELCSRLVSAKRADLLTPARLVGPALWLSLSYVFESMRVFPTEAADYRARFENALSALRLSWDEDGDGVIDDKDATTAGASLNPAAPVTGGY